MDRKSATVLCAIIASLGWIGVVISSIIQKTDVDEQIRKFDPSAVQIQQLNGSATTHILVAITIGIALTIPLLIVAIYAIVNREPPAPQAASQPPRHEAVTADETRHKEPAPTA